MFTLILPNMIEAMETIARILNPRKRAEHAREQMVLTQLKKEAEMACIQREMDSIWREMTARINRSSGAPIQMLASRYITKKRAAKRITKEYERLSTMTSHIDTALGSLETNEQLVDGIDASFMCRSGYRNLKKNMMKFQMLQTEQSSIDSLGDEIMSSTAGGGGDDDDEQDTEIEKIIAQLRAEVLINLDPPPRGQPAPEEIDGDSRLERLMAERNRY